VAKNAQLAAQRAEALRAALIARGVQPERLVARGYGAERPVCGQHNAACWARNRRVELTILERAEEPSRQAPVAAESPRDVPPPIAPPPGKLGEIESAIQSGAKQSALAQAFVWHDQEPGDTLALVALGEAAEAIGDPRTAARAYGSIIDLYPGRADLRRYAGERLEHLGADGLALAIDTYAKARAERPDHPSSHRLHAFALLRAGRPSEAFAVLADGLQRKYPDNRFLGVERVLREDAGLVAAAWIAKQPNMRDEILRRATALGVKPPTKPSLRFVLNWETDANDVDLHVWDEAGRHAWYAHKDLGSGGALYADVTTGYGPECFTIRGPAAGRAFPYTLQAHYYSRGPMGYGMGKLEVIEHDGHGQLRFDERPFVLLVDGGDVDLGTVSAPLMAQAAAHK
jgi:tetratricopeptide (TPR) repeat protein